MKGYQVEIFSTCIVYLLNGNKEKNKIDKYLQILLLDRQIDERVISLLG